MEKQGCIAQSVKSQSRA